MLVSTALPTRALPPRDAQAAAPQHARSLPSLCLLPCSQVRSHMPASLVPQLPFLLEALVRLLRQAVLHQPLTLQAQEALIKCWKRAVQVGAALVSRHLDHLDPR